MSTSDALPRGAAAPWREQAIARSLDGARVRAEQRVQRFLDAATSLIDAKGLDFTVQDVVDGSGQSLRSFYQSFDGKQHLLLAVYEQAMAASAERMREVLTAETEPLERLRLFVVTLYEWCEFEPIESPSANHRTVRALADFVFAQLMADRDTATSATASMFDQLVELVIEAQRAGLVRAGSARRLATVVIQSTMFCAFGGPRHATPDGHRRGAEEMWEFCFRGVGA